MLRRTMAILLAAGVLTLTATAETPSWQYGQDVDPMSDRTTYWAKIESVNTVDFAPPYDGEQRATLMLRGESGFFTADVMLVIEKGQFLCLPTSSLYQNCNGVLVRFDDKKSARHDTTEPADLSSNVLFIDNNPVGGFGSSGGFVGKMRKAKRLRIAADIYQEGAPIFEFDVSGFDADKYKPKK